MQSISKKLDNKVINSVNGLQSRKVNNPEEGNYPVQKLENMRMKNRTSGTRGTMSSVPTVL